MKKLFAAILCCSLFSIATYAQAPTLGVYTNTSIITGANTIVSPASAPTNTTSTVAYTNTNFTGVLSVDPASGNVRVTDAKQAGVYTVTVKASGPGGTATQTFALTVTDPNCSQGAFQSQTNFSVGLSPQAVAIGDFNGDNNQDIATANYGGNDISVRLGNGAGGFGASSNYGAGTYPFYIITSEFNGDGFQDLAIANTGSNNISVKLGNGAGAFPTTITVPAGTAVIAVESGDFNNDGIQDLATANQSAASVSVFLGIGDGTFSPAVNFGVGNTPQSVAAGDFNGDGNADLVTANQGSNNISVLIGNGAGSFAAAVNYAAGTQPFFVSVTDFTEDGIQDLAVANYAGGNFSVLIGSGTGTFGAATNYTVGSAPYALTTGDLNGDGLQDVATTGISSANVSVRLGNGAGGFGPTSVYATGSTPMTVEPGDFNQDGIHDLVTANYSNSVSILLGGTAEINLTGNAVSITDGDVTPSSSDHTDFGSVLACTGTIVRTFMIQNTGNAALYLGGSSSISITGANAGDFTAIGFPPTSIAAGGVGGFQIQFNPSAVGLRSAIINVANDDCNENPYNFSIQGTGNADLTNPTITCPANILTTASAGQCSAVVTYSTPSVSDNCGTPTLTQTSGLASGSAFPVGVTVNSFLVTDGSGNTATCSFSVTVTDTQAPVLYNMSTVASSNATGGAYSDGWQNGDNDGTGFGAWTLNASTGNTAQAGFLVGSSTTNGSGVDSNGDQDINSGGAALGMYANSAQATQATRSLSSPLSIGRVLRVELDNGNVDNGQIIGFQMLNSAGNSLGEVRYRGGQAGYEIVDINGITPFTSIPFTDEGIIIEVTPTAVGVASITLTRKVNGATQTLTSLLFPGGGNQTISRIMIFNSNAGTGVSRLLYVNNLTVLNVVAGCPANINVTNNAGVCGATVNYNPVIAIDNCNASLAVTQTAGLPSGSVFPVGTTTNSFSATDGAGNTATCSFNVTVTDTSRPVASCQNRTLYLNGAGNANIIAAMVNNGSTDNCGIASMSASPTSFSCANVGTNNVTLTVTDAAGNSSTCTSVVTVLDSIRPVVSTQNVTVQLNAAGTVNITPAMVNNGSADVCGIASMSVSPNSFSCANLGANTVTLTVTDVNGNSRSGNAIVTVMDTIRPVASCQNINAYLNSSGTVNAFFPLFVSNTFNDNCGSVTVSFSASNFNCSNIGANNVTVTGTDDSGNMSSCISVVTVLDTIRPVANCQNLTLYLNASGTANITAAMVNNGSTDACGIASMSVAPNSFSCANVGTNSAVLSVTDVNGNVSTCNSIVTVIDTVRPVAIAQNLTVTLTGGTASVTAAAINNGSSDACGIASMTVSPNTFTCSNLGPNTVTLTVTDVNGNTSTATAVVTVLSDLTSNAAPDNNVSCFGGSDGQATISTTGGAGPFTYSWSPSGGTSATATGLSAGTYTATVTDGGGCTTSSTVTITQPGSAVTASSVAGTVLCNGGSTTVTVTGAGGTAPYTGEGTFTVTAGTYSYTVTDANGCTATTSLTITEPTTLTASSSATSIACNGGNATVTVTGSGGTAPYTGEGTFTVTAGTYSYTVTDANGCTATTSLTITEPTTLTASSSATSIACNGGNATVTVTGSGGTAPYTGEGTFTVSAGTYSYTVTDANGCTATTSITVTEPTVLSANSSATSIACNGGNATVTVTGAGGTAPYTGEGNFTVSAGTYSYTVTDANGCTATTSITVTEPTALSASSSATSILCNGGTATVTVTGAGGTSPYTGEGNFTVSAGTYSYTVTDANGCTATTSITVTEPTVLSASSSATSIACNGGTATVTVTGAGGTSPYTGEGTFTVSAGTYSYTVTDANGCTATTSITVTEPTALSASSSATSILCNGGTATATVTGAGGTSPYTGEGTFTVSAGTYSYTVTDANGCTATTSITVTEPTVLSANSSATSIACNGGNATVTVVGSGGTAPYTGEGTFTVTAGTYSYTVTDANGCTATTSLTITEPTILTASSSATSIACNGGNATVTVTGAGGTAPYTGEGAFTVSAGTYSYTVTDANGCTSTTSITVTEPTALSATSSATSILCNGGTAIVTVSGTGGTSPYTGEGNFTVTAGTYSYTVTDNNGCTSTTSIVITEPNAITTTVTSTNVLCFGGATGSIDLTVSGGTGPYTFDWNNGTFTTEDLVNIPAGTYSGVLTDANGCTDSGIITITEPPVLSATITSQSDPTTCSGTDGSIDNTVAGGTLPYSFLWSNAATTEDIAGVPAGVYTCDITDANGCTATVNAILNDPNAPAVSFALAMDTVCFDDGAFVLTGESPSGGVFSGNGVSGGSFSPSVAGAGTHVITYTYTDISGCSGTALDTIIVDLCLNVVTNSGVMELTVYPNPNNGTFTIGIMSREIVEVQITNALGQQVESRKVSPMSSEQFSVQEAGAYWITAIGADGSRVSKQVIVTR